MVKTRVINDHYIIACCVCYCIHWCYLCQPRLFTNRQRCGANSSMRVFISGVQSVYPELSHKNRKIRYEHYFYVRVDFGDQFSHCGDNQHGMGSTMDNPDSFSVAFSKKGVNYFTSTSRRKRIQTRSML